MTILEVGTGTRKSTANQRKHKKTARITEIIELVQIMKYKKENKNNIQINKGNNNVQNSNITKTMENFERESEYRAGKETNRKYNYLHPQFKYCNEYNIYIQKTRKIIITKRQNKSKKNSRKEIFI